MKFRLTSPYGELSQIRNHVHKGIDLAMPEGTPLNSLSSGVIERIVNTQGGIGKGVIVKFNDGTQGIYGHLSGVNVKEGQYVGTGEIIGYSGNTGHSTGPHLHFALKENGQFVNPTQYADKLAGEQNGILTELGKWFIERGKPGTYEHADYNVWSDIGEKMLSGFVHHWLPDFMLALPFLAGVSVGMWGLLAMVNKRLATWGVTAVMILGGLVII
jgi:hypothetical protein